MHVTGPSSVASSGMHSAWPASNGAAVGINSPPMGTIPLNTVIDYIVHKSYHDIVVMADLLPGKSDMEKKIDVAHFANRTRQLVIRLLAVVKWAASVTKVMKCEEITQLLDQQSMLFIDTADKLHTLSNQLVVQARLPNFAIPAAVDVLTTGTYPRLPKAIRDKIIPPDPISSQEKSAALQRLNEIIMHRLVTTKIPLQIAQLVVDKGRATLIIPGEFKATLTLMGDAEDVPWRLLKLEFMVTDKETGGGRALVHDLQVNYIHELVQSRLVDNIDPLEDLYRVLHSFCLSLKIEVIQAQAVRLIQKRWGRLVQIEEYQSGMKVVLSYWRLTPYKSSKQEEPMTVAVHQTLRNDFWFLEVTHKPPLVLQNVSLVENASKIKDLSFERLLGDTTLVRSFRKLYDLYQLVQKHVRNEKSRITEDKSCLIIPLIQPYHTNEYLSISVDPQTGIYVPTLPVISQEVLDEVEKSINEAPVNLLPHIPKLRKILAKKHCKSSIQNLPAICMESLFLTNKNTHAIGALSTDLIFIKLSNFSQHYIVIEIVDNEEDAMVVVYRYHLLGVLSTPNRQGTAQDLKADMLVSLERLRQDFNAESSRDYLNSELSSIVSVCDARIPFINLTHELAKEGLMHQGIIHEGINIGLCVKLITFPEIPASILPPPLSHMFVSSLLDCSFQMVDKSAKLAEAAGMKIWHADLVFCNSPLKTESTNGNITRVSLKLDFSDSSSPVNLFNDEWTSILRLFGPVSEFAQVLNNDEGFMRHQVSVYSYDYKSLVLKYGKDKSLMVTIKWSVQNEKFVLSFGRCNSVAYNSHAIMAQYLNNLFNTGPDIGQLIQVLHDTFEPLQATCSLSSVPLIGMTFNQSTVTQQNAKSVSESFFIVVQTVSHLRLIYRFTFAVDVYCLPNKKVALRDGAFSKFDSTKVKEGMQPIPGLKTFMSLFESHGGRQRSTVEKDNPPLVDIQNEAGLKLGYHKTIGHGIWAGGNSTILEQETFTMLLNEQVHSAGAKQSCMSILEQFLGLTLIRRELERIIHSPSQENYYFPSANLVPNLPVNDSLTTFFATNSLMFRVAIQFHNDRPSLILKVQQAPPMVLQERGFQQENWRNDNLLVLEQFFKVRVAAPPFRPSNVHAFCSIISSRSVVLMDFINVMRLELANHQSDPSVRWTPQICLTVPPRLSYAPSGVPAVYIKDKILIFILMTMKSPPNTQVNRQGIIMPIVCYPQSNISTLPGRNNPLLTRIDAHLKQWMERRQPNTECHMSGAVKYLMNNFTLQ